MNSAWLWVAIAVVGIGAAWAGVSWQVLLLVGFLLLCAIPMLMMGRRDRHESEDGEISRVADRPDAPKHE